MDQLVAMRPEFSLDDGRAEDVWEPLIGIADQLNAELGQQVRRIAAQMTKQTTADKESLAILLLGDIKELFDLKRNQKPEGDPNADKYTSAALCEELARLEERPWAALGRERKPITQHRLSSLLKDFQIAPHNIRLGDAIPKGFERKDFEDAWLRYLASQPSTDTEKDENTTKSEQSTKGENAPPNEAPETPEEGAESTKDEGKDTDVFF